MPEVISLFILGLVLGLVVFPIWAIFRIRELGSAKELLARQLQALETELRELRFQVRALADRPADISRSSRAPEVTQAPAAAAPPAVTPATAPVVPPELPSVVVAAQPMAEAAEPAVMQPSVDSPSPVAEPAPEPLLAASAASGTETPGAPPPLAPAPAPATPPPIEPPPTPPSWSPEPPLGPRINWEQFMGAKLFAWLGGLAGLLAVGFFVKYSFEHDLIPPEVRVAIGFLFGLGLVVGGLKIDRARYAVTAQTLIATGVVSLYTVTFACRSVYHFAFFGPVPTFLLMGLITTVAFLLAVRLEARVVAILGILGGFLTPVLVSTGQNNPWGLFGYVALLDVGLVAVALHRRWDYLVPLGAIGTLLTQVGWAAKFFSEDSAVTVIVVCAGFAALFLGAAIWARRRGIGSETLAGAAVAMAMGCLGFGLFLVGYPAVGARVGLVFSLGLLASLSLLALAWYEEKPVLVGLAAVGVAVLQTLWAVEILTPALAPTAMGVSLGFCVFFLAAYLVAAWCGRAAREIAWSAIIPPFVAFGFALVFMRYPAIALRPGLLFTFVLLADVCLLVVAWCDDEWPKLHLVAGTVVFALLAAWTGGRLTAALLPWALAFTLLYAVVHTAFPLLLERHRPAAAPTWWSQLFPPLALLLLLLPLFKLTELSLLFWPCVLLVDLLAIGLAVLTASLLAVGAVLVLTLVATGAWIFQVPVGGGATPGLLLVIGGFAALFFAAGLYLARRFGDRLAAMPSLAALGDPRAQLPSLSALLPFLLLIMMTARLALPSPSPVFGLALLLVVLVLGLALLLRIEWLPACALVGVGGLEHLWHQRHFAADQAGGPLGWYLVFLGIFAAFPFVFRRRLAAQTGSWAVAALSGVVQFPLVHRLVTTAWPNPVPGIVPALFVLPPLISLVVVRRGAAADARIQLNQLAWFGGVALLFVTLIFPIQLDRQWLTLGWALEGAALLWLYHRVPHPGLRGVGAVLLVTAFARLALNPAVLAYHPRSDTAILNWYLYSYGVVTLCLFAGMRLAILPAPAAGTPAADPARRSHILGVNAPALFASLGTILAFLLLNLEIADFFSAPGQRVLTFKFSGHFGRDMTYTIAWALFALGLLLASIWRRTRAGRYAALALLSVTLVKLFFHDLAHLGSLYRIGALFAVAVIATIASFAYQRFLPVHEPEHPPKS